MWVAVAVALGLAGVYLAACFLIAWVCVRPPRVPFFLSPGLLGAPQTAVEFRGRGGHRLRGWWTDIEEPAAVAVLAHGYGANRSEPVPIATWMWERGIACLVFDFPAHGASEGREVGFGWKEREDVLAALAHARERYPGVPLVLWGSSMGASAAAFAVAEESAALRPVALILDCPYGRLAQGIDGWWRFVGGPRLALFLKPAAWFAAVLTGTSPKHIDTAHALRDVGTIPVLILAGARDTVLPPAQATRLLDANPNAELVTFEGCHHCEGRYLHPELYRKALADFMDLALAVEAQDRRPRPPA